MTESVESSEVEQPTFDQLPLSPDVRRAIAEMGFRHPTPVQLSAFEPAAAGSDLIVQARTGTGKTLGFALPLVDRLVNESSEVQALVLAPTRELALQSAREIEKVARFHELRTVAVYGGASMEKQIAALKAGAQIVSGTPGRVLDHLRRGTLDPRTIRVLVLDEADEMFSMGFAKELNAIMDTLPSDRQMLCFSATIDNNVQRIADRRMHEPQFITLSSDAVGASEISHYLYMAMTGDKLDYLLRILEVEDPESAIIFCNTKAETESVARALQAAGHDADWLNGDLPQSEREKIMRRTREGKLRYMVATDVAARGIDISHLTHVINYGFPEAAEQYVHRTGRTGRAGRTGTAISIVGPENLGAVYYLRLTYKIFPLERSLPSEAEERTRVEADRVGLLVRDLGGLAGEAEYELTRRLLGHPQGNQVVAGLLARYFDESGGTERFDAEARALRTSAETREGSSDAARDARADAGDQADNGSDATTQSPRKRKRRKRKTAQAEPTQGDAQSQDETQSQDEAQFQDEAQSQDETRPRHEARGPVAIASPEEPAPLLDDTMTTLYLNVGKRHGVAKAEISSLLRERSGVTGDDLGRVRVRDGHTFVGVPSERADAVIESLSGVELGGSELLVERART